MLDYIGDKYEDKEALKHGAIEGGVGVDMGDVVVDIRGVLHGREEGMGQGILIMDCFACPCWSVVVVVGPICLALFGDG